MSIEITVRDTENGDTETTVIDNDYVLVTAGQYYLDGITKHGNGTTVLTIKVQNSSDK